MGLVTDVINWLTVTLPLVTCPGRSEALAGTQERSKRSSRVAVLRIFIVSPRGPQMALGVELDPSSGEV